MFPPPQTWWEAFSFGLCLNCFFLLGSFEISFYFAMDTVKFQIFGGNDHSLVILFLKQELMTKTNTHYLDSVACPQTLHHHLASFVDIILV